MVSRKTTRSKKDKPVTIPKLRKAFERIEHFALTKVSKLPEKEGIKLFRNEWKKTFGKDLTPELAKDYLYFLKLNKGSQNGGAYSPAPIGYDMAGGDKAPSVPPYVTYAEGGMRPVDSFTQSCGSKSAFLPPAIGGKRKTRKRKQTGGGVLSSFSEFLSRPVGMSAPPSQLQDVQMLVKGYPYFPSSRPEINDVNIPPRQISYNATINPISVKF